MGTDNSIYNSSPDHESTKADPHVVTSLNYAHVLNAGTSWVEAFEHDPFTRYTRDTPGFTHGPIRRGLLKLVMAVLMALWIRRKKVFTIDQGKVSAIATFPHSPSIIDRLFDLSTFITLQVLKMLYSSEGRKRNEESQSKMKAVIVEKIGYERAKNMISVNGLATAPSRQGRGCGGAVLRAVTQLADSQSRATWLASVNIANTKFYNSHGFVTVGEAVIGDSNPGWKEPPIIARIMVREPQPVYD